MDDSHSIRRAIVAQMGAGGWSVNRLAREAGVAQPHLNRFVTGAADMRAASCARVLEAMGLEIRPKKKNKGKKGQKTA